MARTKAVCDLRLEKALPAVLGVYLDVPAGVVVDEAMTHCECGLRWLCGVLTALIDGRVAEDGLGGGWGMAS